MNLDEFDPKSLKNMSNSAFRDFSATLIQEQQRLRKECQILFYEPNSPRAMKIHESNARILGIGGGNGSGKTEGMLLEASALATGCIPFSLRDVPGMRERQRGPCNIRIIVESLTTTLHQTLLPKLKWYHWTGVDEPGGDKGHYGWIPRDCLIGGSWDKSWSEKLRVLRVLYRNPDRYEEVLGESTLQWMSHDQDPSSFASGDYQFVGFDEPPKRAIWTENEARTMRVAGRMMLAMTWPDDPSIPVDWLFDQIYDKAQDGPNRDPDIEWLDLWTTENRTLNQDAVAKQSASWSDEVRSVRIHGRPIRFSNRIHPTFTDADDWWCFACGKTIAPIEQKCGCGSGEIVRFNHVEPFEAHPNWPTVWVLDPHPRKPHMFAWIQIDPSDDWWVVREGEVSGTPVEVREFCDSVESELGLNVKQRLIDPNMGASPSMATDRKATWQEEFTKAGLVTDLADSSEVGRARINEMLKPDRATRSPRIHVHPTCRGTIHQIKRFVWDDYRTSLEKDQKQKAKQKNDDYPAIWRYLANSEPTFNKLVDGYRIIRRSQIRTPRRPSSRSPQRIGA